MATSKVYYEGGLRCELTHLKSGNVMITDAPIDNHGKGEAFSPTDLLATSLASCMITIMGIFADKRNLDISGTQAIVAKMMSNEGPRRVAAIEIVMNVPDRSLSEEDKLGLIRSAKTCPVAQSLSVDIEQKLQLNFVKN